MADKEMSTQRLRRAVEERCRFLLRQSVMRGPSGDTSSGIYSTISNAYDKGELLQVIAILGMCNPKAIYEDLNFKSEFFRRGHRNNSNVRKYLTWFKGELDKKRVVIEADEPQKPVDIFGNDIGKWLKIWFLTEAQRHGEKIREFMFFLLHYLHYLHGY